MAVVAQATQKDFLDNFTDFFTTNSRDFFKTCHQFFFWNKYLTGVETSAVKSGLSTFSTLFDSFSILDMMGNFNAIRNHFLGKEIKDVTLLASDTANSVCESVIWFKGAAGVLNVGAVASSWLTSGSGATLMYSFGKRTIQEIKDLKNLHLTQNEKSTKLWDVAKNVGLFAIGVLLFTNGWLGWALNLTLLTMFSAVTIVSSFATHLIKNTRTVEFS